MEALRGLFKATAVSDRLGARCQVKYMLQLHMQSLRLREKNTFFLNTSNIMIIFVQICPMIEAIYVKRPRSHFLSHACQKTGQSLGLFFPDRMYLNRENGFHISHDKHRTITDSGISLLLLLWQEEPPPPLSTGQMSACPSPDFNTRHAWLVIWNRGRRSFL